jgi:hypothetical protein
VACDADGRASDVFVLRMSEQGATARPALVRALYEATVTPGEPVEGWITFNWCRVRDSGGSPPRDVS